MATDQLEIRQEILITAAREVVWDYLVNQNGLQAWLNADICILDIVEGGQILVPCPEEKIQIVGETALMMPPEKLSISWIERRNDGTEWMFPTFVHLELKASDSSTLLTLTHTGFNHLPSQVQESTCAKYAAYWNSPSKLEFWQDKSKDSFDPQS